MLGVAQLSFVWVILFVVMMIAWNKCKLFKIPFILCLLMVAWYGGMMRYQSFIPDTNLIPYEQEVRFTGYLKQPPVNTHDAQKLYIVTEAFAGDVYVKTGVFPEYQYGEVMNINCRLLKPEPFDTFAFDKYLARYGVLSICQQAQIYPTGEIAGNPIYHQLYNIRDWFRQVIREIWPEPVASLLLGVILGIQDDIPDDIVEQFRITGTIHILVVSGMHVMIIAQLLSRVGLRWLSYRRLIFLVAVALFAFCVITGLAASVVRASIMGILPLLAKAFFRRPVMHYSLAAVAGLMVLVNPYILLHDAGFQLSFLATVGLVYFQPLADKICWWMPRQFTIRETLSTTLAATLTTTPFVMSTFGMLSVVNIISNLIVVPISTIMLFAGFGVVIANQIAPMLTKYAAYVLWLLVSAMLEFIARLSALPWAMIDDIQVPKIVTLATYALITLYIIWSVHKKSSSQLSS